MEDDLDADILFNDPVAIVVAQGHRMARRRKVQLEELLDEPWILPPPASLPGGLAQHLFGTVGLALPRAPVMTMSLHVTCNLLATNRFVATLPRSLLRFNLSNAGLKILPVCLPEQVRPVAIVTVKNRTPSPTAALFLRFARTVTKRLASNLFVPNGSP